MAGRGQYLGEFEQLVLLALARLGAEAYGMGVRREIQQTLGRNPSIGSVYATLERLESKRYVTSSHTEPEEGEGGKPRRTFKLSPRGLGALENSRKEFELMWQGVSLGTRATSR